MATGAVSGTIKVDKAVTAISGFGASVDAGGTLLVKGTGTAVPVQIEYPSNGKTGWRTATTIQTSRPGASVPGCQVLNDVVINQVLFRFQDDQTTDRILRHVVDSGEAWMSGTTFDGHRAIRLSVSNWQTTHHDITRALDAFHKAASQ